MNATAGWRAMLMVTVLALGPTTAWGVQLKVATLHPLLKDLLERVGGERVEVVDLIGAAGDPHKFEPGTKELEAARGAALYFVSGKGLEPYLPKLRDIVGAERVVEVGESLPTRQAEMLCDHGEHEHVHEMEDPHWWHSLDCWKRAAVVVAARLAAVDPDPAAGYMARALEMRTELEQLNEWVRAELGKVPAERRVLATAHAAFSYFCHDYGWRMLPVQGLNREQVAAPRFVGEVAETLRREKIPAVFPERHANPKMLEILSREVGVKIGKALWADGGDSIERMFRHNVGAIVAALGVEEK